MKKHQLFMCLLFLLAVLIAGCSNSLTGDVIQAEKGKIATGEVKEFKIEAFRYGFSPSVIEVNQGDKVKIIASSRDVPHSLTLPDFGVNLYLDGIRTQKAEFIADKKGTFIFYCAVPCGSGHGRMRGKFIVK